MGAHVSTGFIGDTLVTLDYAHSFNLVNRDTRGGNEVMLVMLWISVGERSVAVEYLKRPLAKG
jgi:hypothetical protein